jgi:hydrogenase maturation protein HypF
MWIALLDDLDKEIPIDIVSQRFHLGLANIIVEMAVYLTDKSENPWQGRIALSGGVFQNKILTETVTSQLADKRFEVYTHQQVPSNDGGLSFGQAAIAAARDL